MARLLLALVGVVVVLSLAVVALAYGSGPARSGERALDGLGAPVTVAWSDSGRAVVEAQTPADLAAGLGYVHGADHAWTLVLWRQIARGTMSEWFGDSAAVRDRHARTLGFEAIAQETYRQLPPERRALLDAYARGVNLALADPGVAQGDAFVLSGVEPDPWRPWDALSVERLIAYLGTSPPQNDSSWVAAVQDPSVARFVRADSSFRAFAGIGGTELSRAFVAGPNRDLFVHLATGASALSFFVPVELRLGGRAVAVATVPGTLLTPVGAGNGAAWGVLLTGDLRVEPLIGRVPPPVNSRLVERDGDESLLSVLRDSTGLALGVSRETAPARTVARPDTTALAPTAPDTTAPVSPPASAAPPADTSAVPGRPAPPPPAGWRVVWPGFSPGTDLFAFTSLWEGRAPGRFHLFRGDGLLSTSAGPRALGQPAVTRAGAGYALVAAAPPARYAAARLDSLAGDSTSLPADALARDAVSEWAAGLLPPLIAALGNRDSLGTELQAPYSYLKGWDHAYTADAIAPSLFETWLLAHESVTGAAPNLRDSVDVRLLPYTLRIARAELRDRFGPLPTDWSWGVVQGGLHYPVLGRRSGPIAQPYRLRAMGPGGHTTALRPGPSLVFAPRAPGGPVVPPTTRGLAVWTFRATPDGGTLWTWAPVTEPSGNTYSEAVDTDGGPPLALRASDAVPARRLVLVPRP